MGHWDLGRVTKKKQGQGQKYLYNTAQNTGIDLVNKSLLATRKVTTHVMHWNAFVRHCHL